MKKQKVHRQVGTFNDNEKIELSNTQQNPGAAKPEDFTVNEVQPFGGQNGDSRAERRRLMQIRATKRRKPYIPTPDRHDVNEAELPKTGSRLK
jgi:hypothetical protein